MEILKYIVAILLCLLLSPWLLSLATGRWKCTRQCRKKP